MQHDSGRVAMWVSSALMGLLRHKGVLSDNEIGQLAASLERHAEGEGPEEQADMRRAAQWLRHSIPPAND